MYVSVGLVESERGTPLKPREPTDEEMRYGDALRWANWAVQNGQAVGTMGAITRRAIGRMDLPEPPLQIYNGLLLSITRMVMNGPTFVDHGPEPRPERPKPQEPMRVNVTSKPVKKALVTPPPRLLN